jgi:hypothetical protein
MQVRLNEGFQGKWALLQDSFLEIFWA